MFFKVSTEGPRFRTLAVDSVMVVVQVPLNPPTLTVSTPYKNDETKWQNDSEEVYIFIKAGASLNVQCSSDLSYPRPNISIFINNILLNKQNVHCYKDESMIHGFLQKGIVTVDFQLNEDLLG